MVAQHRMMFGTMCGDGQLIQCEVMVGVILCDGWRNVGCNVGPVGGDVSCNVGI